MADQSSSLFFDFPPVPSTLLEAGHEVVYEAGAMVVEHGERAGGCLLILDGLVFATNIDEQGEKTLGLVIDRGALMNEASILLEIPSPMGFQAQTRTLARFIPEGEFRNICGREPNVALYLAQLSASKMLAVRNVYALRSKHSTMWRVCYVLLSFSKRYGVDFEHGRLIDFPLSQQLIADFIGANRITVTKCMKRLKASNIIRKVNDRYQIVNMEGLLRCMNT